MPRISRDACGLERVCEECPQHGVTAPGVKEVCVYWICSKESEFLWSWEDTMGVRGPSRSGAGDGVGFTIQAFKRQRQKHHHTYKASLVYMIQRRSCLQTQTTKAQKRLELQWNPEEEEDNRRACSWKEGRDGEEDTNEGSFVAARSQSRSIGYVALGILSRKSPRGQPLSNFPTTAVKDFSGHSAEHTSNSGSSGSLGEPVWEAGVKVTCSGI